MLDVSYIEEQLDDLIMALRSMKIMLDVKIIILLSGMENAEASHDLFENNINGHIYVPMVENYIIKE